MLPMENKFYTKNSSCVSYLYTPAWTNTKKLDSGSCFSQTMLDTKIYSNSIHFNFHHYIQHRLSKWWEGDH